MIVPAGFEKMSESELAAALVKEGYSEDAAKYLAGKLKGTIKDNNIIQ